MASEPRPIYVIMGDQGLEVAQAVDGKLLVGIEPCEPNDPHFMTLPHGELTTVWTPAEGARIHFSAIVVSVESSGEISIYRGDTEMARLHFNQKKAVPLPIPMDIHLDIDEPIKAKYTADAATPDGFITVVGHEH